MMQANDSNESMGAATGDESARDIEACVVGKGPVGSFAALCLQAKGIPVRVLDAQGERPLRSYACGLHLETLRLIDALGLTELIHEGAHRVDRLTVWRDLERVGSVDFGALRGPFPYLLTLRQSELEDILAQALAERGVEVLARQELTALRLGEHGVRTEAVPQWALGRGHEPGWSGEPLVRQADYVIGADGYASSCREALGIDFVDLARTEVFAICEFQADLAEFQRELHIVLTEDSVHAFWPLGPSVGRWTFQLHEQLDQVPSLDTLRAALHTYAPWFHPRPEQLSWGATAHFERRLARHFGAGRVWLAGDAAHVTSPIGFQNMNRGFIEASELATLVAGALPHSKPSAAGFAEFERRQWAEWQRLLGIGTHVQSHGRLTVEEASRLVPSLPASGLDLDHLMAQLGIEFA